MWQSRPIFVEYKSFAIDVSTQHTGNRILGNVHVLENYRPRGLQLAIVPSESTSNCKTTSKGTCRKDSWGAPGLHICHRPTEYEMQSTAFLKVFQWELLHILELLILLFRKCECALVDNLNIHWIITRFVPHNWIVQCHAQNKTKKMHKIKKMVNRAA